METVKTSKIYRIYRQHINGIIATLLFHIIVMIILLFSNFKIKQEFVESEMIIDFGEPAIEEQIEEPKDKQEENAEQETNNGSESIQQTNVASNRTSTSSRKSDQFFDQEYRDELEKARQLAHDVSSQLSKDIPTINDLKMAEEVQDDDMEEPKNFSGDSNIEYFLENRYHTRLPIPVYLAQKGGKVTVSIKVDRKGNVISAEISDTAGIDEMILSYAKTAALRTKFNSDPSAPNPQAGKITYKFIAQ